MITFLLSIMTCDLIQMVHSQSNFGLKICYVVKDHWNGWQHYFIENIVPFLRRSVSQKFTVPKQNSVSSLAWSKQQPKIASPCQMVMKHNIKNVNDFSRYWKAWQLYQNMWLQQANVLSPLPWNWARQIVWASLHALGDEIHTHTLLAMISHGSRLMWWHCHLEKCWTIIQTDSWSHVPCINSMDRKEKYPQIPRTFFHVNTFLWFLGKVLLYAWRVWTHHKYSK